MDSNTDAQTHVLEVLLQQCRCLRKARKPEIALEAAKLEVEFKLRLEAVAKADKEAA